MLDAYVPLLAMVGIALFIAVFVLSVSRILGPQKPTVRKLAPYESGMEPIGEATARFPIKFNLIAMIFILFDIRPTNFLSLVDTKTGIQAISDRFDQSCKVLWVTCEENRKSWLWNRDHRL